MLATGGYRFWQYRQAQAAQAAGAAFQDGAAARRRRQARRGAAPRSPSCRRTRRAATPHLSRFVDAALALKKDPKAGVAAYDALAADGALDPLLRDTAKLRAALARLDAGEADAARRRWSRWPPAAPIARPRG